MKSSDRTIIALYGPAGIGKTSVARKLANKLPGKTARLSVDVMRDMTCVRLKGGWKESDDYIVAAKKALIPMTREYVKLGYNIVIEVTPTTKDDGGKTDRWLAAALKKMEAKVCLLHAPLEVVLKRNEKRRGEFGQGNLSRKLTEKLYGYCETYLDKKDYHVIDTARAGADKITRSILGQ